MSLPQLIAVDMDGTFLDSSGNYDRERFAALYRRLREANITFAAASGNQYWQIRTFFSDFPDVLYVAENGALVGSYTDIWRALTLSEAAVSATVDLLKSMPDVLVLLCGADSAYTLSGYPPATIDVMRTWYTRLALVEEWTDVKEGVLKIALDCPAEQTSQLLERFALELPSELVAVSSGHGSIDLIGQRASKATGLAFLGERLGIDPAAMIAFGDGGNDLSMLEYVGTGVAMANAAASVKASANATTTSNDEAGVLAYVEGILASAGPRTAQADGGGAG